ncbi:hypothetical protein scyTo_0022619 [Scyliorhinus torazame]|uniref:Reverse transcriptase domain-containing protein n=1 Tax=Scyliorhinus torazame TaxID=75743 RepID=A0A401Q9S0_SCYTO|nr:hypothetical protein [Scyliorhinus torazame]
MVRFERERFINKQLDTVLTTKSAKQISDKRRILRRTQTEAPAATEDNPAEDVCDERLLPYHHCEDQERLKDIDNWRPITIGPMLLRLFTKIMAKGLSETVWINPRQKGFLAATPGCNENIAILENIIKGARKNRKDLAVVFVDLANAFDSVGHKLLVKALQRMRLPPDFTTMVTDLYTGNTTMGEGNKTKTAEIKTERGVKQGDPLEPMLFNISLDPLICSLEEANSGVITPERESSQLLCFGLRE